MGLSVHLDRMPVRREGALRGQAQRRLALVLLLLEKVLLLLFLLRELMCLLRVELLLLLLRVQVVVGDVVMRLRLRILPARLCVARLLLLLLLLLGEQQLLLAQKVVRVGVGMHGWG